jgi:carbonic anhydrase/acetyltransferase-like protein (isoleucine patch superfamily)
MGDVTLDQETSVWYNAVIRGDMAPITIGAQTNIQDGTIVHVDEGVPCTVGRRVGVGHRVILHGCTVEDDCLIGMGSVILNNVRIGTGSVVAAGAVIPEGMQVPPSSVVMGVPGRIVRRVDAALAARIAGTWRHYVEQAKAHRAGRFPLAETGAAALK